MFTFAAALSVGLMLQGQEPPVLVRAKTLDGCTLVGVGTLKSVKVESKLGTFDIPIRGLVSVTFEKEQVSVRCKDGTLVKGNVALDGLTVAGVAGPVELKRGQLKELEFFEGTLTYASREGLKPCMATVSVNTLEDNVISGTAILNTFTFDSSVGKFELGYWDVVSIQRSEGKLLLNLKDGTVILGSMRLPDLKIMTQLGELTAGPDSIKSIWVNLPRGVRAEPAEPGPARVPPPQPKEPPAPVAPADLKPVSKAGLKSVLSNFIVSRDGRSLYAVNISDSNLIRWSLPDIVQTGVVPLKGSEFAVAESPEGKELVALGPRAVTVVSADNMQVVSSFQVECDLRDMHVIDGKSILALGSYGAVLISIPKTAIVARIQASASWLNPGPSSDRVYSGWGAFVLNRKASGETEVQWQCSDSLNMTHVHKLSVSTDGKFGASGPDGMVYRLGRCWTASLVPVARLEAHESSVFSPDGKHLHLFTGAGFMKTYDTEQFQLQSSKSIGMVVTQATYEPGGKTLLLTGSTQQKWGRVPIGANQYHTGRIVDLYRLEIPK